MRREQRTFNAKGAKMNDFDRNEVCGNGPVCPNCRDEDCDFCGPDYESEVDDDSLDDGFDNSDDYDDYDYGDYDDGRWDDDPSPYGG